MSTPMATDFMIGDRVTWKLPHRRIDWTGTVVQIMTSDNTVRLRADPQFYTYGSEWAFDSGNCHRAQPEDLTLIIRGAVVANTTMPMVNDHTCASCGNERCSRTEKSCWKCGSPIVLTKT